MSNHNRRYRDNLKPWPKGKSGNPKGRPPVPSPGWLVREYARQMAEERDPKTQQTLTEALVRSLFKYALKGSLGHFRVFLDLIESDGPGDRAGWQDSEQFDVDGPALLVAKLCRVYQLERAAGVSKPESKPD